MNTDKIKEIVREELLVLNEGIENANVNHRMLVREFYSKLEEKISGI